MKLGRTERYRTRTSPPMRKFLGVAAKMGFIDLAESLALIWILEIEASKIPKTELESSIKITGRIRDQLFINIIYRINNKTEVIAFYTRSSEFQ